MPHTDTTGPVSGGEKPLSIGQRMGSPHYIEATRNRIIEAVGTACAGHDIHVDGHGVVSMDFDRWARLKPAIDAVLEEAITTASGAILKHAALASAPPAPVVGVPAGWKLVPEEPTEEMLDGFRKYAQGLSIMRAYRVMLYNTPSAPPAPSTAEGEKPCHWGGGNDIIWCSTCGAEYAYAKGETRPACPRVSPVPGPAGGRASEVKQLRDALEYIARGTALCYDESEGCDVEVNIDAEDLSEVAYNALRVGDSTSSLLSPRSPTEEARDLTASERVSAAQAVYDEWMADYDPQAPDHEVYLFEAMKAAIATADAHSPSPVPGPAGDLAGQGEPVAWAWEYREERSGERWVSTIRDSRPAEAPFRRNIRPLYEVPAPSRTAVTEEDIAKTIDAVPVGYSINLKSLTEEGRTYTLDLGDGSETREFGDSEDAREFALQHWSLVRARAVLSLFRDADRAAGEGAR